MKMNREQFEALAPELGHTIAYKIFALQSDHFLSEYNIHCFDPRDVYHISICTHPKACELVDDIDTYHAFQLHDDATYLRLLENSKSYIHPRRMTKKLCSKIIAMRPDWIRHIDNKYIDTQIYLDFIKRQNIRNFRYVNQIHYHDKEFLLYIWNIDPDLSRGIHKAFFTKEIAAEFHQRYDKDNTPHDIPAITEESLHENLTRQIIPAGTIPIELLTPAVINMIAGINRTYLMNHARQFITKEMFDQHYTLFGSLFPQYVDSDTLERLYQTHNVFQVEHAELYDRDTLYQIICDRRSDIQDITDPYIVYDLISRNNDLAKYVTPDMITTALSTRSKSARS